MKVPASNLMPTTALVPAMTTPISPVANSLSTAYIPSPMAFSAASGGTGGGIKNPSPIDMVKVMGPNGPETYTDPVNITIELTREFLKRFEKHIPSIAPLPGDEAESYRELLGNFYIRERRLTGLLKEIVADAEHMGIAARTAIMQYGDSFYAGLVLGGLNTTYDRYQNFPNYETFGVGLRTGQVLAIKYSSPALQLARLTMGAATVAGVLHLRFLGQEIDPSEMQQIDMIYEPAHYAALATLAYGFVTKFTKPETQPMSAFTETLQTTGAYRFHRYPMSVSLYTYLTTITSGAIAINMASTSPSPLYSALTAGAFTTFVFANHLLVRSDEAAKERAFGQVYTDYKAKTPRYLPDLWKGVQRIVDGIKKRLS